MITRFTAAVLAIAALAAPAWAQEPEVRPITIVGAIIDPNAPQAAVEEEDASVAELAVISESDELPAASTAEAGTNLSEAVEAQ